MGGKSFAEIKAAANGAGQSPAPQDFEDFVSQGLELLHARDKNSWALGDLVGDFEVKLGRPTDPEAPTLSDLASALDVELPRLSEWRNVAKFYPVKFRMNELSWSHHNMARRAAKGNLKEAQRLLNMAINQHYGVAAFRQHLAGILYEGRRETRYLPADLQVFAGNDAEVWITIKRIDAEDNQ